MSEIMSEGSKSIYLREHPLFAHLDTGKIESLSTLLKVKAYSRGDICGYGDGAYHKICLLLKGKIKIAANDEEGNEESRE